MSFPLVPLLAFLEQNPFIVETHAFGFWWLAAMPTIFGFLCLFFGINRETRIYSIRFFVLAAAFVVLGFYAMVIVAVGFLLFVLIELGKGLAAGATIVRANGNNED